MPFKKINMKIYGYKKCETKYKKWRKCIDAKIIVKPCLNNYKLFYFCNNKINYKLPKN